MKTKFLVIALMALFISQYTCYAQTKITDTLNDINNAAEVDSAIRANAKEPLCYSKDDAEWFTANNQMRGKRGDEKLTNMLLRACREQLFDKLQRLVKQVTTGYFDQMDINGNSSEAEHIEGASMTTVEQYVNALEDYCQKEATYVDDNGNVSLHEEIILYMTIRASKKDIINAVNNAIKNDAIANTHYNEEKFRQMYKEVLQNSKSQE